MKKVLIAIFTLTLLGAGMAIAFSADAGQQTCRERRMGQGTACADAKAPTITLTGTVQAISTPETGQRGPALLTVTAGNNTHRVMVGPAWFLSTLKLSVKSGDQLTITGWSITYQKTPIVLAQELTLAGKTYNLRDASGKPVWAGKRCSGTAGDPAACKQSCPASTCNECPMKERRSSCRQSGRCCGANSSDSTTSSSSGAAQ
ncbi:MAG: hypothetical protein ACYDBB_00970 [Armatimonadota bacterium]